VRPKVQLGLASFQFMINSRRAIFYTFLTLFMAEALGADFIQLGLSITLPQLINSIMQALVWGPVSDRIRRRRLLIVIGECAAGIGYLLLWTSISIWSIIIGLTVIEAIWSMSNTGWSALFADLTDPQERSTVMGRVNAVGVVGRLVGIGAIGLIYDYPTPKAGFPWAFPICAAVMFTSVVALVATVPEIERMPRQRSPSSALPSSRVRNESSARSVRAFFVFLVCWAIVTIGWACYQSLLSVYLRGKLGLTAPELSLAMGLNAAVGLISAPLGGYLGDRIGRKPVLLSAMLIQAVGTALYSVTTNLPMLLVVATVEGVPRQVFYTIGYALAADLIPGSLRGRLFGAYNGVWTLAFGGSPTAVGGVFATWREGVYVAYGFPPVPAALQAIMDTFLLSAGIMLVGAVCFAFLVHETRKRREASNPPKTVDL
jgi:MFS family permease